MSITGARRRRRRRADEGRRRDQRRRRPACSGPCRDPRGARSARERDGACGRRSRPADRRLAARRRPSRSSSTRPRTRSSPASPRAGSATPTRTSSRTRRSRRPTARSRSPSGRERQWPRFCGALGLPALADDPRFATNGDRVERRAELRPDRSPPASPRGRRAEWLAAPRRAPTSRPARSTTSLAAFASPEAAALGDDGRAGAPGLGRHPPGRHPVRVRPRRRPRSGPPPPLLGEHTDEILAELGYAADDDRATPCGGVV